MEYKIGKVVCKKPHNSRTKFVLNQVDETYEFYAMDRLDHCDAHHSDIAKFFGLENVIGGAELRIIYKDPTMYIGGYCGSFQRASFELMEPFLPLILNEYNKLNEDINKIENIIGKEKSFDLFRP